MNLRKLAEGRQCQARIPGVCCHDSSTVVAAHLNGAGMALKNHDLFAAYVCHKCHEWLDYGYATTKVNIGNSRQMRDLWHLEAIIRTQKILLDEGFIKI